MKTDLFVEGFSFLVGDCSAEELAPFTPISKLRRVEQMAKNLLLCSFRACESYSASAREEMGLSLAIGAGSLENTCKFLDSILTDGDELSSPTAFAGSVHNATGLTLSLFLNTHGPCITTGQLDNSFAAALLTAQQFLAQGMCPRVLVAVADDVNKTAAELVPQYPERFAPYVRCVNGPFVRAAAAFLLTNTPTEKTIFHLKNFTFARTERTASQAKNPYTSPAFLAVEWARQLNEKKPFSLRDSFGGADVLLEAEPYVHP